MKLENSLSDLLRGPVDEVAQRLLGCYLIRNINGVELIGKIVETEAYDQTDQASHSFRGPTPRTEIMFGPSGYTYVYFTYGMHYCMNVVTGEIGHGSAVLIRAIEPLKGIEVMRSNRHDIEKDKEITNGPAKLCQALRVDKQLNGHSLDKEPLQLVIKPAVNSNSVITTTRIGIQHEADSLLRFYINDNQFVSKT
jgi:DNA-3-methyladenine glycosylase